MMRPRRLPIFACLGAATLACSSPARADEIVISGIPLSGVIVRGLDGCEVQYSMAGRPNARAVDRLTLHLDAMPALERAEAQAAQGNLEEALTLLDEAGTQATQPWHKTWVHYRRTRLLDGAGRYTLACRAWATLLLTSTDACWAEAMPTSPPDRPGKAEAEQALSQLRLARAKAKDDSLAADLLDAAIESISKIEAAEAAPRPDPQPPPQGEDRGEAEESREPAAPAPRVVIGPAIADEIDRLLNADQLSEARREIEVLVAEPKQYPLDRLLHQYGRVLAMQSQPRDAAVRFMQCAILFAQGPHAASSLFETARLYAGPLNESVAARRLLDRAQSLAAANGESRLVERIQAALAELNSRR